MAGALSNSTSRLIGALFCDGSATGMTDAQLLDRFVSDRDAPAEHAFEVLVRRHGPMVQSVCRSVLGDQHEAEDAFQATFLVLARRASSLREPANLGPWLYGVARRTSQKAKARRSRLERLIQRAGVMARVGSEAGAAGNPVHGREEAEMLHEEIGRLPEKYRTPVVLCDLEGLSHEEAAKQLGWPMGTLGVRLMRARERLRARLTRRGMSPAGFATILPLAPAMKPLADSMAIQTARSALFFASKSSAAFVTIPSQVTAMALGVLRTMSLRKFEVGMAKILACLLIMAGSAAIAFQAPAKRPNTTKPSPTPQKSKATVEGSKSILENGGFERGDTRGRTLANWEKGAAIAGVQYLWDQTEAHEGRASLHLKKTAQRYFPIAQWSQEVKRQGKVPNLKVVAFIKARKMTKAILDVQFLDRDGQGSHQWAIYIGAKDSRDKPATHDWKKYEGVVAIPDGTEKLVVAAQIYGPGDVWFDDVRAEYTDAKPTDATASNPADSSSKGPDPNLADVDDVPVGRAEGGRRPAKTLLLDRAEGRFDRTGRGIPALDPATRRRWWGRFQPLRAEDRQERPPVRLSRRPAGGRRLVARTGQGGRLANCDRQAAGCRVHDRGVRQRGDRRRIADEEARPAFHLHTRLVVGRAAGLCDLRSRQGTRLTGSFVAMSVFRPERYEHLENARGRGYYILHSPQDFIPIDMATEARDELRRYGAHVELRTYEGGHGWRGDVYGEIRRGIKWLEANHAAPAVGR